MDNSINELIFTSDYMPFVLVSFILYLLYSIVTLIDTNMYIKDVGIGEVIVTKAKFIYSYIAGYLVYILRLIVSLLLLYILITVIRIAIVVILTMLTPVANPSTFNQQIFNIIKAACRENAITALGPLFIDNYFKITFFLVLPFLIFYSLIYALVIYKPNGIKEAIEDQQNQDKGMYMLNTFHSFMMFTIVCIVMVTLTSMLIQYKGDYTERLIPIEQKAMAALS